MKTWTILGVFVVFFACSKKDIQPPTQLFLNTDIETGGTKPGSWWYNNNNDPNVHMIWTDSIAHSGKHSLEITNTTSGAPVSYWGQSITSSIPFGRTITLNAYVKGVVPSGDGIAIALACLNASSTTNAVQFSTTQYTHPISGTFDWTEYSVSITGVHTDITEIRVYLMMMPGSAGKVFFDDITLTAQ